MSNTCSFVKSDGEGPGGETSYGVKRKSDAKMEYLARPGRKARKKANTNSPHQVSRRDPYSLSGASS
jgi:hypothetical protein